MSLLLGAEVYLKIVLLLDVHCVHTLVCAAVCERTPTSVVMVDVNVHAHLPLLVGVSARW